MNTFIIRCILSVCFALALWFSSTVPSVEAYPGTVVTTGYHNGNSTDNSLIE